MLLNFADDINLSGHVEAFGGDAQRLINRRHLLLFKFNVNDGADDLHDAAKVLSVRASISVRRSHTLKTPLTN